MQMVKVRGLRAVIMLSTVFALGWAGEALAAKDPTVSVRLNSSGFDAELHLQSVGVGLAYFPIGGGTEIIGVCKDEVSRTFFMGRYFLNGPQDSVYFGLMAYSETLTSSGCGVTEAKSGILPMVGYHWLWDSGLNVDLGLRPGLIAVGFSF